LGPTSTAPPRCAERAQRAPNHWSLSPSSTIRGVTRSQAIRKKLISSTVNGSLTSRSRVITPTVSSPRRSGRLHTVMGPWRVLNSPAARFTTVVSGGAG